MELFIVMANGDLLWFRHEGRSNGSFSWADNNGRKIGTGWSFEKLFSA
jgi:hypothetical protein